MEATIPSLSIAILSFQRPAGLLKLCETLHRQLALIRERDRIEVLISDDCSGESMRECLDQIESRHGFRIERQPVNLGFSGNLSFLLNRCTGERILFVGDDDVPLDDWFASFLESAKSGCDLLLFRTLPDRPLDGMAGGFEGTLTSADGVLEKLGLFHLTFIGNFIVNRQALASVLRPEDLQSLYPHVIGVIRLLNQGRKAFVTRKALFHFQDAGARWDHALLSAVDLARCLTLNQFQNSKWVDLIYRRLVRSLPRALLHSRDRRRSLRWHSKDNPYRSLALRSVLGCYSASRKWQMMAALLWMAGRFLPLGVLRRILGERPRKVNFS